MTTTLPQEAPGAPQQDAPSWGNVAVQLAGEIARLTEYDRGGLAALRRMDPDAPDHATFWRLMAKHDLLRGGAWEEEWGLILHGIALMTPTNAGEGARRTAHDGYMPVGKALYLGGVDRRETAFYSDARLNRLLTAREEVLRTLLARMFRMLASANAAFNWREMAEFILSQRNEEEAETRRRRIARDYYRAERSGRTSDEEND